MIELIQADAVQWLENEAKNGPRFQCIFTDPPYWTLNKWAGMGSTARMGLGRKGTGSDKRDEKFYETISPDQLYQCMMAFDQLLYPNSHLYLMCDDEVSDTIKQFYNSKTLAFNYCKRIVWDKIDRGMGYHYRGTYEHIMAMTRDQLLEELENKAEESDFSQIEYICFLEKGRRRLLDEAQPDIVHYKRVQGKHYPTEKPFALVEQFILQSTKEGDWVLDPFCGSGVVGAVCQQHNRNAVLVDISDKSIEWVTNRLALQKLELPKQLELI